MIDLMKDILNGSAGDVLVDHSKSSSNTTFLIGASMIPKVLDLLKRKQKPKLLRNNGCNTKEFLILGFCSDKANCGYDGMHVVVRYIGDKPNTSNSLYGIAVA